jgi:hypothetical protein
VDGRTFQLNVIEVISRDAPRQTLWT